MISVTVYYLTGDIRNGKLLYTISGPNLLHDNREADISVNNEIEISLNEDLNSENIELPANIRFYVSAKSIARKYSIQPLFQNEMYPKSTHGWIQHLSDSGQDALFSIQEVVGKAQYVLSVVDMESKQLLRLHRIQSYESDILFMETNWERYQRILSETSDDVQETQLVHILEASSPSWSQIARLIEGVTIPNLKLGKTVRETMNQLVPISFPNNIRQELMAFLAFILHLEVPKEDPLEYLRKMRKRFQSAPLLRNLVLGHIQCLIEGIKPPDYVKIMFMAEKGLLRRGIEPTPMKRDAWVEAWFRVMEVLPNRRSIVAEIAKTLNQEEKITLNIPITKEQAKDSKHSWLDRFSIIRSGLMIRGHIQDRKIGLVKLVYLGGAHRWPHKHLAWSARLGNPEDNPPYFQVMVVPTVIAERIIRTSPKITQISWSAARINYHLFNPSKEQWRAGIKQIIKSITGSKTVSQLNKEFGIDDGISHYMPSEADAKILDLISSGMYLQSSELGYYDGVLNIPRNKLNDALIKLQKAGILQVQYFSYLSNLASVCMEIKGPIENLRSITRACLKHLPSTTAFLSERNKVCYIIGRIPEESAYNILVDFPKQKYENGISIRAYRATALSNYINNLYFRILKKDGSWDDDLSSFLNQIRS